MKRQLRALVRNFEAVAMPRRGRYVTKPALMDEHGVISVPPAVSDPVPKIAAMILGLATITTIGLVIARNRRRRLA